MQPITLDPNAWYYFLFNLDQYLELIFAGNWKTFFILFAILVGLARVSPWKWDETILNVIREAVAGFLPTSAKVPTYQTLEISGEIEQAETPAKKPPAKK